MITSSAIGQVDVAAWPLVKMNIMVIAAEGEPVPQLGADSITVREAGKPQSVLDLKPVSEPQSVCLLLQSSLRMTDQWPDLIAAANRVLQDLPSADEVCVADFAFQTNVDSELSHDRGQAAAGLSVIGIPHGGTALWDALNALGELMRKGSQYGSRTIIMISTCDDNDSTMKNAEMRRKMEVAGSPVVYVLKIPMPGKDAARQRESTEKIALMLAKMGGGAAYFPHDVTQMATSADQMVKAMRGRYEITYRSSNEVRGGSGRQLDVKLNDASQTKSAFVSAPEQYYAP